MALADIIKSIFGSKVERDYKSLKPVLNKFFEVYPSINALSDDELREHSAALRRRLAEVEAPFEERIASIREALAGDIPVAEKEKLAGESDKLVKDEDEAIEKCLTEILPEAFAIMKSTGRRFKENDTITVTATDFDRDLSVNHDFVRIEGDKAVYSNHWVAGGNEIVWDMEHYGEPGKNDREQAGSACQIIGGIALHKGKIAEMATGEGKTLVATLPVFLNALAGKGVHVVTVNDYLSKRDSEWMGPLYMFHGLSVDCIDKHQPNSDARRRAYECDITFGTNNEFGFDYLRDNMAVTQEDLVQRKHHFAIVDEVDSVLIDDARTPLIISGPVQKSSDDDAQYNEYKPYVERLYQAQRQLVNKCLNEAKRLISSGDEREGGKLLLRAHKGLPKYQPLIKYLSEPGIKVILQKTENYYIQDNEKEMPVITDPLYFVINEQLNSVVKTDKGDAMLAEAVNDDNFFVLPDVGARTAEIMQGGGTAQEKQAAKDALMEEFSLKSERVHVVEQLLKAYAMFEKDVDYIISPDGKVKIVDESTGRIMEGRRWSDGLHQAVEAKENVKVEASTQTFATITLQNYFRMYHKLAGMTGTAETEAGEFWSIYKLDVMVIPTHRPVVRTDNDDLIYKTKKAKYAAVIDKVAELSAAGRPVLVGTTDVETSELLSRMLRMRGIRHNVLNAKEHAREAEIVAQAGQSSTVTIATNMAGRGTDIKLSEEVRNAGGLAIIGTERHDSRRVDRQLRGRAGRQGDPGSSTFYISLEDKLMRLFGSERIAGMVDRLGMKDDEALESSMLSGAIERAQKKVEENNFGIRKRLLEYDDVMNYQREAVYSRRRNAISGDKIEIDLSNMMVDAATVFVEKTGRMSLEDFRESLMARFSIDLEMSDEEFAKIRDNELVERIVEVMRETWRRRMDSIDEKLYPIIKEVYEKQGSMYRNIAIPVSDGLKTITLSVNLEKAYGNGGHEVSATLSRNIVLYQIDEHWKQHLRDMDDLKQSVQNAVYEQKDPVVQYKLESYNLFSAMLEELNRDVLSFLFRSFIPLSDRPSQPQRAVKPSTDMSRMRAQHNELSTNGEQKANTPVKVDKHVGRNDPCPCGSGLKYKNCHGKGLV
ncbi:MAG: preprotein translocase subunit SecA [Bacteroidales bacterium]|nr:preprotein translocase subunit SecA [Bacteroidales bacterium]